MSPPLPAIIVLSSHVARGSVGVRASAFALERLGFPVWIVPTIVLPFHPGHGPGERIVPPADSFSALIDDLIASPWLGEVGGILSGYLGEPGQVAPVRRLVESVKARNPRALYCCDPVIGDAGRLYVTEDLAIAMRDRLVPAADIATPNLFELAWLTGKVVKELDDVVDAARSLAAHSVIATSVPSRRKRHIGAALVTDAHAHLADHAHIDNAPKGTGDLFSALVLARLLEGRDPPQAMARAAAGVLEVVAATARLGREELALEAAQRGLVHPSAPVGLQRLGLAGSGSGAPKPQPL